MSIWASDWLVTNNLPKFWHFHFTDKTIVHNIFHKTSDKSFGGGQILNSFSPTVLFYSWRDKSMNIMNFCLKTYI